MIKSWIGLHWLSLKTCSKESFVQESEDTVKLSIFYSLQRIRLTSCVFMTQMGFYWFTKPVHKSDHASHTASYCAQYMPFLCNHIQLGLPTWVKYNFCLRNLDSALRHHSKQYREHLQIVKYLQMNIMISQYFLPSPNYCSF